MGRMTWQCQNCRFTLKTWTVVWSHELPMHGQLHLGQQSLLRLTEAREDLQIPIQKATLSSTTWQSFFGRWLGPELR